MLPSWTGVQAGTSAPINADWHTAVAGRLASFVAHPQGDLIASIGLAAHIIWEYEASASMLSCSVFRSMAY